MCNSCSPHRIVIPYQFIVRPPGQPSRYPPGYSGGPDFGGGDRVRLCNPCVPDPNTTPPQTQGQGPPSPYSPHSPSGRHRSRSSVNNPRGYQGITGPPPHFVRTPPFLGPSRDRSVTLVSFFYFGLFYSILSNPSLVFHFKVLLHLLNRFRRLARRRNTYHRPWEDTAPGTITTGHPRARSCSGHLRPLVLNTFVAQKPAPSITCTTWTFQAIPRQHHHHKQVPPEPTQDRQASIKSPKKMSARSVTASSHPATSRILKRSVNRTSQCAYKHILTTAALPPPADPTSRPEAVVRILWRRRQQLGELLACFRTRQQKRTVLIVQSAPSASRSSRSGSPWRGWSVCVDFTRCAY